MRAVWNIDFAAAATGIRRSRYWPHEYAREGGSEDTTTPVGGVGERRVRSDRSPSRRGRGGRAPSRAGVLGAREHALGCDAVRRARQVSPVPPGRRGGVACVVLEAWEDDRVEEAGGVVFESRRQGYPDAHIGGSAPVGPSSSRSLGGRLGLPTEPGTETPFRSGLCRSTDSCIPTTPGPTMRGACLPPRSDPVRTMPLAGGSPRQCVEALCAPAGFRAEEVRSMSAIKRGGDGA